MAFDKLLVLDLDETLVHATVRPLDRPPDFHAGRYAVYKRPGVDSFLGFCFREFERVAVWTASTLDYAVVVLSELMALPRLELLWGRERCTYRVDPETRDIEHLKDIRKLKRRGYDARKIIYVDDTPQKIARSYGNLVPVRAFEGDRDDRELELLELYLAWLGGVDNVRTIEKRWWRAGLLARHGGQGDG